MKQFSRLKGCSMANLTESVKQHKIGTKSAERINNFFFLFLLGKTRPTHIVVVFQLAVMLWSYEPSGRGAHHSLLDSSLTCPLNVVGS